MSVAETTRIGLDGYPVAMSISCSGFKTYRRNAKAEMRPYVPGENLDRVSASAGSPKEGDMIARNPKNHDDQWLVSAEYFRDFFEADAEWSSDPIVTDAMLTAGRGALYAAATTKVLGETVGLRLDCNEDDLLSRVYHAMHAARPQ